MANYSSVISDKEQVARKQSVQQCKPTHLSRLREAQLWKKKNRIHVKKISSSRLLAISDLSLSLATNLSYMTTFAAMSRRVIRVGLLTTLFK